ncbi:sulfotransferase 1 family member D1-like [Diabrotica virgifera virgifera]|uniref:Sulfotransferase 1 family member D1-like n=1 Tax=Diabrotica virgifera virgifera TaxID=50390 RepID=A0A6P7FKV0_DIAVI|nr:sulfotransferase 1 family member D1-like [Diabrotica virgifera virgifera]
MKVITKKPLEGKCGEITDKHLGIKHALWEFNPGKCLLPAFFENYAPQILSAPVRKDDVWLISYPRTGSTWCQEMIWLLNNNLDFQKAQSTVQQLRAPLIEMSVALFEYTDQFKDVFTNSVDYVNSLASPRCIKSHLPLQLLPVELEQTKPKIIYCTRNPNDTCVSFYYHVKLLHGFNVTFETFCELFLNGSVIYGDFFDHVSEFWKKRQDENVLFIQYEQMKKDSRAAIRKIAKFLEKDVTDDDVESLNNFLQFSNMKENRACNCEVLLDKKGGKKYFEKAGYHFIRKGEVGDWKNHMTPEIEDKFDDYIKRRTFETDCNVY